MTDDELERRLQQAPGMQPSPSLRERVMARLAEELVAPPHHGRSMGWMVAASIVLALGLNLLAVAVVQHRVTYYLRSAQALPVRLAHASPGDAMSLAVSSPAWMQWLAASSPADREDFERYANDLVARATQ